MLHRIRLIFGLASLVTLEPMLIFRSFGEAIEMGAAHTENLLITKVCRTKFGYSEAVCQHLSKPGNEMEQEMVYKYVNTFQLVDQWMETPTSLFYTLIMGGLADNFGCRPIFMFVLFGSVVRATCDLVNYLFLDVLPLEFFYAKNLYLLFGGSTIFFVVYQTFAASATTQEYRSTRLACFMSSMSIGFLSGTALSPYLFIWTGYLGIYLTELVMAILALLYVTLFVRDPVEEARKDSRLAPVNESPLSLLSFARWRHLFTTYITNPFVEMVKALVRKRDLQMRPVIALFFFMNLLIYIVMYGNSITYLYLTQAFDNYDRTAYSHLIIYVSCAQLFGTLVVVPALNRLGVNESLILIAMCILSSMACIVSAFASQVWQYWLAQTFVLEYINYSVGRAQLSKCLDNSEIGKVLSAFYLTPAFMHFVGPTVYRMLYEHTIDTFNSAYLLLSAACYLLAGLFNLAILTKSHLIEEHARQVKEKYARIRQEKDKSRISL